MEDNKIIAPDYWEKRYWKYRKSVLGFNEALVNAETLNVEYREKLDELSKAFDKAEQMVDNLSKENESLSKQIKAYEKRLGYKTYPDISTSEIFYESKDEKPCITGSDLFH